MNAVNRGDLLRLQFFIIIIILRARYNYAHDFLAEKCAAFVVNNAAACFLCCIGISEVVCLPLAGYYIRRELNPGLAFVGEQCSRDS